MSAVSNVEHAGGGRLLWIRGVSPEQQRNFWAAFLGFMLDAMDFLFYALVIAILIRQFHMNPALAGFLSSVSLVASAVGGLLFGALTDYLGRSRVLIITVLVYSVASLGAATSQGWQQLLLWRVILGLGMGGEWGAGNALITETFSPKVRGQGVSLVQSAWAFGYLAAVVLAGLIIPHFTWRGLFAVGIIPALLVFWVRRRIQEPSLWKSKKLSIEAQTSGRTSFHMLLKGLFGRQVASRTLLMCWVCVFGNMGYQAVAIWLPTFLHGPTKMGGLGFSLGTMVHLLIAFNVGNIFGFWLFGWLADRYGRKISLIVFAALNIVVVPIAFLSVAHQASAGVLFYAFLALTGALAGFFAYYGMAVAELFPTSVRGSALGFIYNIGRVLGGQAPVIIGAMSGVYGFGLAMVGVAVGGYVLTFLGALVTPETKGLELA